MLNYMFAKQSLMKRVIKYNDDLVDNPDTKNALIKISSNFPKNIEPAKIVMETDSEDLESQALTKTKSPKKHQNKFLISAVDLTKRIFCCNFHSEKSDIYNKGEKRLVHYFDLVTYMKKMDEVDTLKYMLLDENSLRLMNFVSKPGISSESNESDKKNPFFNDDPENKFAEPNYVEELKLIHKSYLELKNKEQISDPERRIINLFEKQVKDIVELSEIKQNEAN